MDTTLAQGEELGGYTIAGLLGIGGMGQVYRAVQTATGRDVAIKVLSGSESRDAFRFENEAVLQSSLSHRNLVAFHETFIDRGRRCLVMEYVPGESLADRLRRSGRLNMAEAISVVGQIAAAAAHMHAAGIVHRDLKPFNVRITPDGTVKVLDFGIAKGRQTPALTGNGEMVGTPEYSSPEQLRSGAATPRSDVWALGILLYEVLTGHVPFRGRFPSQVWTAIQRGPQPSLSAVIADPAQAVRLNEVLARCLSLEPRRRFANAAELAAALGGRAQKPRDGVARRIWLAAMCLPVVTMLTAAVWPHGAAPAAGAAVAPKTPHRIDVTQGTADVVLDGREIGRTPLDYPAASREVVTLELRQPGFEPLVQRFDVSRRAVWTFTMRPTAQEGR